MKFKIILMILFLPNYILACGDSLKPDIALEPTHSVDPVFRSPQNAGTEGKAKALLRINNQGVVLNVEIVSVKPEKLDKGPILKALKKTKFTKGHDVNDYVYVMEFQISDASF